MTKAERGAKLASSFDECMSQEQLQAHFDQYPLEPLGKGCQMHVYGTEKLVLKEVCSDPDLGPLAGDELTRQCRFSHEWGLTCLGGLALPYELPDEITTHTIQGWWLWKKRVERVFQKPVVQIRVPDSETLSAHLNTAVEVRDADKVDELLRAYIDLRRRLIGVGAFPRDPSGDNYVLHKDQLLVRDVGGLILSKGMIKRVIGDNECRQKMLDLSRANYRGRFTPMSRDVTVQAAWEALDGHFQETFSRRVLSKFGKARSKSPLEPIDLNAL